mgnify:CR=1 FL=1
MAVAPPAKIVYKRKVRCCNIGLVPNQEGVNLTNSPLDLGYGNRAILSNGFRLASSQRGHVSARESKMMIKILTLLKLIIEVLLALLR